MSPVADVPAVDPRLNFSTGDRSCLCCFPHRGILRPRKAVVAMTFRSRNAQFVPFGTARSQPIATRDRSSLAGRRVSRYRR